MNIKIKQELYTSPQVEVVEIKVMKMLCGSPYDNGITDPTRDGDTDI